MGGYDPYSSSKGCAELVTSAYRSSFFNPSKYSEHGVALASARAGNVIGGGDWALDRLIPDIMRAIQAGQPACIRNPTAIRPWQHVLEPLSGYLVLAECLYNDGAAFAESWNFGPSEADAKPVEWIVEQLTKGWGDGAAWEMDARPQPHEANYLKLDCSKAANHLHWRPRWSLDHALEKIVHWHRAWIGGANMHDECIRQIAEYSQTR
jgi:CDP-glucose 4,6-dehydratase